MEEDTNDEESEDEDTNDEESVDEDELPHKFVHNSYMNLWRSEEEGLPTINFCVHHDLDSDLKNQLCIKLYVGLLKDSLTEILYQVCYQIGKKSLCPRETAVVKLFENMVANNLYNQLRVKETLGYKVESEVHSIHGINRFIIDVSSSEHDPQHLLDRIFNYVDTVGAFLEGIDGVAFEKCKTVLSGDLPSDDGSNLWDQIAERRFYPGFSKKVSSELRQIKKTDVIKLYEKYLKKSSPHCRRLAVCIWGCNTDSASFV
ncbi:Metalloenzyme LuxS/M16 peptidase-like [Arabidopsis suecica]|uniref:Metalloenzyme LuxS/M16 peptidase-like n=1 Tax=Arabidopsis suecica TaxID=45249 RepID=A0A8T2AGL1_ARASU|nr:Metalloenzyme LuxS/M16 peptidase-like [Arabidopsis suecica]